MGIPPPLPPSFHYPVAGAISPNSNFLYVVDSDFNLQYSGALVNVVNLERARADALAAIADPSQPKRRPASTYIGTSRGSSVRINPFATAAGFRQFATGSEAGRLYVSVRGDGTLTWMDVSPDGSQLECGQQAQGELCDEQHRPGSEEGPRNPRDLTLPPLPTTIDVGNDGFIAIAHQEAPQGKVSLFVDPGPGGPVLTDWLGGLSPNLSALLRINNPAVGASLPAGELPFWHALSRVEPVVNQVRAFPEGVDSFLFRSGSTALAGLAPDVGFRFIVRDPCNPARAFATARPQVPATGTSARSGDQLVALDLTDPVNPTVLQTVGLPTGPSQLVAIPFQGRCAEGTRVYVVSFDARKVYVIDADGLQPVAQIQTQAGPNALIADPLLGTAGHDFLYLIDFTAMVVELIDVDPSRPATVNTVVYTIGDVVRPQESL